MRIYPKKPVERHYRVAGGGGVVSRPLGRVSLGHMWFYMIAAFLVLVGIVGGVASGGIFTIIFIPLGFMMLAVAVLTGMWGRSRQGRAGGETHGSKAGPMPLRHTRPQGTPAPSTPEDLADARRVQQ
jgi:hypothetical protein